MTKKILVVDDNKIDRDTLSYLLEGEYDVIQAENGKEALDILASKNTSISAILLDLMMPVMDGFEVLKEIKIKGLDLALPSIIITSNTDEETKITAMKCGANGFISKPYNHDLLLATLANTIELSETSSLDNELRRDKITGLYNREVFAANARTMLEKQAPGYYMLTCFDIDNFKVVNDQYGTQTGDQVLKYIAQCLEDGCSKMEGICCHYMGDQFAVLFPASFIGSEIVEMTDLQIQNPVCLDRSIRIRVGRYLVDDLSLPVDAMLDRAVIAEESIRGRYDTSFAMYRDDMRKRIVEEQEIVSDMHIALENGQFEPWLQPQYNHANGALIGAEALTRWRHPQKGLIPPKDFIPVFERNGFIFQVDQNIWQQVCILLRHWLDEELSPLPISINISRYDVIVSNFWETLTGFVEKYAIPVDLLRLELTESAFSESSEKIAEIVKRLVKYGFTVEIDDFGSAYSSLNTLKDVPAQILKLDMKFLESSDDLQRSGNILESVVRMARWLGMSVIAEGVETLEQADFLQTIGCNYLQGYFYARPMPEADFERLLRDGKKEPAMKGLDLVRNFNSSSFWNSKSLETLVFNHFSGGAFVFELHNQQYETLRVNREFSKTFHSDLSDEEILLLPPFSDLEGEDYLKFQNMVERALRNGQAESGEFFSTRYSRPGEGESVRLTIRRIAECEDRVLFYGYVDNITEQIQAEIQRKQVESRLQSIIDHVDFGISASTLCQDGKNESIFANDRFLSIIGCTEEQYRDGAVSLMNMMDPDDWTDYDQKMKNLTEVGQMLTFESRIRRPDEKIVWLQNSIRVVDYAGIDSPVLLSSCMDITERKEAEMLLRFLNAMADTIISEPDTEIAVRKILTGLLQYFDADRSFIIELGSENGSAANTCEVCKENIDSAKANRQHLSFSQKDGWFHNIVSQPLTLIRDQDEDGAAVRNWLGVPGVQAMVLVPLFNGKKLRGLAGVDNPKSGLRHLDRMTAPGRYLSSILMRRDMARRIKDTTESRQVIMDGIPGGFVRLKIMPDGSLKHLFTSDGYMRMLGLNRQQIIAGYKGGIQSYVHPDDVSIVETAIRETLSGSEKKGLRYRLRTGTGDYICVSVNTELRQNDVGETYIDVYYTDATEQRIIEEQKADLLDKLPCGAVLYEYDGNKIVPKYLNRFYWQMLGRADRPDEDSSFLDAVYPDDRTVIMTELDSAIRQKRNFSVNVRMLCGEKGYCPFNIFANVVPQPDGKHLVYASYTHLELDDLAVQSMLRAALNTSMAFSSDFTYVKDPGGHYVAVSKSMLDLLGFVGENEIIGKSDYELFNDSVARQFARNDQRVLQDGVAVLDHEEIVVGKNSERIFTITSKYPLWSAAGKVIGLYGISRNATRLHETTFELNMLLNCVPSGVLKYSADEKEEFAYVNRNFVAELGYTEQTFREKFHNCFAEMVYSEDREYAHQQIDLQEGNGGIGKFEYRIEKADGSLRWYHDEGVKITDTDGKAWYYVTMVDVTDRKIAESAILQSDEEFRLAAEFSNLTICRYVIATQTLIMSDRAENTFGFQKEIHGVPQSILEKGVIAENSQKVFTDFFDCILRGKNKGEATYQRKIDGKWCWEQAQFSTVFSKDGKPVSAVISLRDVSEQMEIRKRAETDPLTGVYNRTAFSERLNKQLLQQHEKQLSALLLFDLDNFKMINDTYGHSVGDDVLVHFAQTLNSCIRSDDMVCRMGGDEFFISLCGFQNRVDIAKRVKYIFGQIGNSFPVEGHLTVSLGIALAPQDGNNFETLYLKADRALYYVKKIGRDNYAFYTPEMDTKRS